jgi:hypothetical protein
VRACGVTRRDIGPDENLFTQCTRCWRGLPKLILW